MLLCSDEGAEIVNAGAQKLIRKKEVSFWREGVSAITCLHFQSEGSVRGFYVELHEITPVLRDCPFKRETLYPFLGKEIRYGGSTGHREERGLLGRSPKFCR